MKISVSNIAWTKEYDEAMYAWLSANGIEGIEIAPTRVFELTPYDRIKDAKDWSDEIKKKYGFSISSMQSIWYGRNENIFDSVTERNILVEYTKKAIDFANAIMCRNLVFGCPRNRNVNDGRDSKEAIAFFRELGDYAYEHNTVLAMEANPVIYNTNFCNTTKEAIELIKEVDSKGFKLNLDFGTIVYNDENITHLYENVDVINHVHISEPGLAAVERRAEHKILAEILNENKYEGYVSLETKTTDNLTAVKDTIMYLKEIFV